MNGTSIYTKEKKEYYIYFNIKSLWVAAIQATKYERMVQKRKIIEKKIVEQGIVMEDGKYEKLR